MKYLTILGSTGSIGTNTLSIVKNHPDQFIVKALVAYKNFDLMTRQCLAFKPDYACMINSHAAKMLRANLNTYNISIKVLSGMESACELAAFDEVDTVMSAIVGSAGLLPTLAALRASKRVLLANKESLIICGKIFMDEVYRNQALLLPVDSEHNAIFQILPELYQRRLGYNSLLEHGVSRIIITGSGGAFSQISLADLEKIKPEQVCSHPNWSMGKKISVDSATMMNKGLEYIEARLLFNAKPDQIEILLHPQSIVHSMVSYIDGSVLAQLGLPDIRISIANAMSYPDRIFSGVTDLDFLCFNTLNFSKPDISRYPCLSLAINASHHSQSAVILLNATNEIAVESFLKGIIRFTDIAKINEKALESNSFSEPTNLEEVLYIDKKSREIAYQFLKHYMK